MKRTILLAAVLVMLVTAAVPALAQTTGEAPSEGAARAQPLNGPSNPPPPEYELEGDLLTKDGDTGVFCSSLVQYVEGGGTDVLARRDLALCYQYGFSPAGVTSNTSSPGTSNTMLPATGGVPPLPVAAGLFFASAALVTAGRRKTRQETGGRRRAVLCS